MIIPFNGKDVLPYLPSVLDLETNPDGEVIGVGFAYQDELGKNIYSYHDTLLAWYEYFISLCVKYSRDRYFLKRFTRIYAHNGANFDYLCFYEDLYKEGLIVEGQYFMADSTGIGVCFTLLGFGKPIYLMDSYRMLPASLKSLTKTFGVKNEKIEIDVLPHILKETNIELYYEYLKNDVIGLQQVIKKFWEMIYKMFGNVGFLPMTLPSLSMRIFSKQLKDNILTPENEDLKYFERRAYNGGLTLCMRHGVFENVNVYDVNSMYPAVMVQEEYPRSYKGYWSNQYNPNKIGLWEVEYIQHRRDIPPFLFSEQTGQAAYEGSGVFSTNELNHLSFIGGTFSVKRGYIYIKTEKLFADFVSRLYAERKKAIINKDNALAFTLKIMMNSLYGKFAQREEGYDILLLSGKEQKQKLSEGLELRPLGNFTAIKTHRVVPHTFVSIAAMITANARILLHEQMTAIIDAGYNVVYCDTDSIHVQDYIMESSLELGGMKLEKTGTGAYAGKKLYAIKTDMSEEVKAKGIGRKTIGNKLSFDAIKELALDANAAQSYTFETMPSVKGVLSERQKAAKMTKITRKIKQTKAVWE